MNPRSESTTPPHIILVGSDFSAGSELAIQQAWLLATQRTDAWLHIAHVAHETTRLESLEARVDRREAMAVTLGNALTAHSLGCTQRLGLPPLHHPMNVHVCFGAPGPSMLQLAVDIDANLLVVGSHGKTGLRALFGSVSRYLCEMGRLPVLVSRPKNLGDMPVSEQLEPPCPDCLRTRTDTLGERGWCDRHGRAHVHVHGPGATQRVIYAKRSADFDGAYG